MRSKRPHQSATNLGPLNVKAIEKLFGHELNPGDVVLTSAALFHVRRHHPADVDRCLPFVGGIIANPTYIGDDLNNGNKIELIGRMPGGEGLLVAVNIEKDKRGKYHVASFYPVTQQKIDRRRRSGLLRNTP